MTVKVLAIVILIQTVVARITIDVDENLHVKYSGTETRIVTDEDISNFKIGEENLKSGLEKIYERRPSDAYLTTTPWGDLYNTHSLERVKKVVSITSASVKDISKKPVILVAQDFENSSNNTISVNTGISHTVENTLATSWSRQDEFTVAQDVEYQFNVAVASGAGKTSFSYTYRGGTSEQKSISETMGTTSGMQVELQPGDAVTGVLSASVGILEIELQHKAYLIGTVVANFYPRHRGHYFYFSSIDKVLSHADIDNKFTTTETMRFNYYVEAKLHVYNKKTGELIGN